MQKTRKQTNKEILYKNIENILKDNKITAINASKQTSNHAKQVESILKDQYFVETCDLLEIYQTI